MYMHTFICTYLYIFIYLYITNSKGSTYDAGQAYQGVYSKVTLIYSGLFNAYKQTGSVFNLRFGSICYYNSDQASSKNILK